MEYRTSTDGVGPDDLVGFFEGWPSPPSPERHLALLRGSSHVVLAVDEGRIVGFVTAISDGVLAAYIPLLEVRREWRGKGVGSELVRRITAALDGLYMVGTQELACRSVLPFLCGDSSGRGRSLWVALDDADGLGSVNRRVRASGDALPRCR